MLSLYSVLKLAHILSAALFGGGVVLAAFSYARARKLPDLAEQVVVYRHLRRDVHPTISASAAVAIVTGVALALKGGWPLFRGWVLLSLLWMVPEGIVAVILDRDKTRRRALGEEALAGRAAVDEARRALSSPAVLRSALLSTLLVSGYFFMMVMKPSWP